MLSVTVAESRPQDLQAASRDFVVWLRDQIVPRRSAAWTLILSVTLLATVLSPQGPGDSGFSPAGVVHNVDQRRVLNALADLLAVAEHSSDERVDDVWCNHIVTVDSQGYTDKVLDCRTMAEWRAGRTHATTSSDLLAQAQ